MTAVSALFILGIGRGSFAKKLVEKETMWKLKAHGFCMFPLDVPQTQRFPSSFSHPSQEFAAAAAKPEVSAAGGVLQCMHQRM